MGADGIKSLPPAIAVAQQNELSSFGDASAQALGASGVNEDFRLGYTLGLATARAVLATSAVLSMNNIDPRNIL
jgi:hypothetical protein